ncbi:antitoxin VbhA family protein [Sphingomonas sp. PAMC 26605]|uniref:antitoxin VbhA family protein n=1 Tax=Sphingomonas sp. PAMC 26605 TaxID=1112214 RepID=UPI00026CAD02|nr:antitoxin VbhA family protein [Sphingomonas sp. PAMC 26605]
MNVQRQIKAPSLGAEEQTLRLEAVNFARGSVRFEGFTLSPEVEAINDRYVSGELDSDQHVEAIKALYL